MTVCPVAEGVALVDLHFRNETGTLASYVIQGADEAAIVESGPTTTQAALLRGLDELGVAPERVTAVLLTHIHLDHSGGAGALAPLLPNAQFYVHPVGAPHLVDPARLIRSAARIYGDLMETLWGHIEPVPAERLTVLEDGDRVAIAGRELVALSTPGHASHHHTFWDPAGRIAYTGDVAGTRLPDFYLPLAAVVPPEFDVEAVEASLDRIRALKPAVLCLAHATAVRDVDRHLDILRRQLRDWEDLVKGYVAAGLSEVEMADRLRAVNQRNEDGTPLDPHTARLQEIQSPAAFAVAGYLRYFQTRARRETAG